MVVVGVLDGVGVVSIIIVDVVVVVVIEDLLEGDGSGWTVATGGRIGGGRGRDEEEALRRAEEDGSKTGSIRNTSSNARGPADGGLA